MHMSMLHYYQTDIKWCRQNLIWDSCPLAREDQCTESIHNHRSRKYYFIPLCHDLFHQPSCTYWSYRCPCSIPFTMQVDAVVDNCIIGSVLDKFPAWSTSVVDICVVWGACSLVACVPIIFSTIEGRRRRIKAKSFRWRVARIPNFLSVKV